jgi:hypothetical protein
MATCQMKDCPNKGKDVAVTRTVTTLGGKTVRGTWCLSCSLRVLNGKKFPTETERET